MTIGDRLEYDILNRLKWQIKTGNIPWSTGRTKVAAVQDLLAFGSTMSAEICMWADCDPYEVKSKKKKGTK